ncbi:hypothetical protein SteCoe_28546 [Stentor coeruleus]|uniref:Uncharacterized protein n=1 Tax=Stentor coeruleus TaxID=5963 RepID=A0A1R2B7X8_9CILI|nr:hypothetical protein SteCoe_28546 [Stentor coeruleus]
MVVLFKKTKILVKEIFDVQAKISQKISEDAQQTGNSINFSIRSFKELTDMIQKNTNSLKTLTNLWESPDKIEELVSLKHNLARIKKIFTENINKTKRDIKKISTILIEYKDRCRSSFIEFLKTLDFDLRKALKPLVPNNILQEQLKYKPINPEANLQSTLTPAHTEEDKPGDTTVDKLNNHIQLLINTLEGVAKDLISMAQNAGLKYYEFVDPLVLYSEPPSPLAAPLPDYFSYDLIKCFEEEPAYEIIPLALNEHTKKRLLEKLKNIERGSDGSCNPDTARKISEKLQQLFNQNINEIDLLHLFKDEGLKGTERENIVFDIIHTERSKGNDVCLDDIISANENIGQNANFEVSHNDYSEMLKNIEGKDLTNHYEDREQFGSLQSSIDERFLKDQSRGYLLEKRPSEVISLIRAKSKRRLKDESKPSLKNIKFRASTPNKISARPNGKRSNTPGLKKKKKN